LSDNEKPEAILELRNRLRFDVSALFDRAVGQKIVTERALSPPVLNAIHNLIRGGDSP
jgi:hypothetical protein